jgi:hypothetical protein
MRRVTVHTIVAPKTRSRRPNLSLKSMRAIVVASWMEPEQTLVVGKCWLIALSGAYRGQW